MTSHGSYVTPWAVHTATCPCQRCEETIRQTSITGRPAGQPAGTWWKMATLWKQKRKSEIVLISRSWNRHVTNQMQQGSPDWIPDQNKKERGGTFWGQLEKFVAWILDDVIELVSGLRCDGGTCLSWRPSWVLPSRVLTGETSRCLHYLKRFHEIGDR